jgi:hypothetical protein
MSTSEPKLNSEVVLDSVVKPRRRRGEFFNNAYGCMLRNGLEYGQKSILVSI